MRQKEKAKTWIDLPAKGYGSAPTPDGRSLVLALPGAAKVAIINLADFAIAKTIDVPKSPQEVLIRPDGKLLMSPATPAIRSRLSISRIGLSPCWKQAKEPMGSHGRMRDKWDHFNTIGLGLENLIFFVQPQRMTRCMLSFLPSWPPPYPLASLQIRRIVPEPHPIFLRLRGRDPEQVFHELQLPFQQ
jgi:hypothetical protein